MSFFRNVDSVGLAGARAYVADIGFGEFPASSSLSLIQPGPTGASQPKRPKIHCCS